MKRARRFCRAKSQSNRTTQAAKPAHRRRPGIEDLEKRVLLSLPTQWTSLGVGGGGSFFEPSFNPRNNNEIWVSTDMSDEYHSTNGGVSWTVPSYSQIQGNHVAPVQYTSTPNLLFALGPSNYPEKSTDGGNTWTMLPNNPASNADSFIVNYNNPNQFFISSYSKVYFTTNGGTSYSTLTTPDGYVAGAYFNGSNIYLGTDTGVMTSTDGGASFSAPSAPGISMPADGIFSFAGSTAGGVTQLFAVTATESNIYPGQEGNICYSFTGLYTLTVGNTNWTPVSGIPAGTDPAFVSMEPNDISDIVLAGGSSSSAPTVVKSTNGGASWTSLFQTTNNANIQTAWQGYGGVHYGWGMGEFAMGFAQSLTNPNEMMITDEAGAHMTTNGGASWWAVYVNPANLNPPGQATPTTGSYQGNGMEDTSSWYLTFPSANNILASFTDITGVSTTNGGTTWSFNDNNGNSYNTTYQTVIQPGTGYLYAAVSSIHDIYQWGSYITDNRIDAGNGAVLFSTNGGSNWSTLHNFNHPVVWQAIDPAHPNTMYASVVNHAGGAGGIWVSTNINLGAASTWTQLLAPPRTEGHPLDIDILNDGTLVVTFAATINSSGGFDASSGVFTSTNQGASWTDTTASYSAMQYFCRDITIDPADPTQNTWFVGVWETTSNQYYPEGGLYKTTNRGQTWSLVPGLPTMEVSQAAFNPANSNEMYVTTADRGLWYTNNAQAASPTFTQVANYPFVAPQRVFFNPYNSGQMWITSFGYGLVEATSVTFTSSVNGHVFQDNNADGTFNGSDAGLTGKTVFLDENNNGTLDSGEPSTATDSNGNYTFAGLASGLSGTARLQTQPSGFVLDNASSNGFTTSSGSNSTVNLGYFPTAYSGVSGNDNYTLQLDGTGSNINVLIGGTVTYSAAKTLASSLTFNLSAGAGSLTVNEANGNPIQSGGITVTGGASADSLSVTGLSGNNAITVNGSQVSVNGAAINYSTLAALTINTGSGNDSLTQTAQPGNGASLTFNNGTGSDSLIVTGGTFAVPSNPTGNLSVTAGGGSSAASVTFAGNASGVHGIDAYSLVSLTVNGNGTATLIAPVSGLTADRTLLTTNSLSVAAGGSVNVTANSIDVHYGSGSDPFSAIRAAVISGQITSSLDDAFHAVGYADGVDGIAKSISSGDILLRYTTMGDANLDGTTGFADLVKVAQNYKATNTSWDTGDFLGTGTTNFSDLVKVAQNYTASLGSTLFNAKQAAVKFSKAMAKVHF